MRHVYVPKKYKSLFLHGLPFLEFGFLKLILVASLFFLTSEVIDL